LTADYKFAEGFLMRSEWRRDFSNQPFFLTNVPGVLKKDQNTANPGSRLVVRQGRQLVTMKRS
jgi:hypothetical protein